MCPPFRTPDVYYGRMSDSQIQSFAIRCGRLMKDYGPAVINTFGPTGNAANTMSVLATPPTP